VSITTLLSERDAFTRGICENPADDNVRMVAADWIEERGDPDHAEFIRDQIEWREGSRDWDLLDAHWERWYPNSRRLDGVGFKRVATGLDVALSCGTVVTFSRGFPSRVRWSRVEAFMSAARSGYWAKQPVTRVEIADRVPDEYLHTDPLGPYYRWFDAGNTRQGAGAPSLLPSELWRAFHDHALVPSLARRGETWEFPSAEAAYDAMSAGAVALGRKLAGLAPVFGDAA
jgi:uncharacterized protein (TIGR02996 family)